MCIAQITYDALDTDTGEVRTGRTRPANRATMRVLLTRLAAKETVVAAEAMTGWRFIAEECVRAALNGSCREHQNTPRRGAALLRGCDLMLVRGGEASSRAPFRADRRPGDNGEMSVEWFDQAKGDPAVIVDPDASWPQQASAWIARLSARLDALRVHVEHVGSTAIAGLPAKPVLDLQVAVPDIDDEQAYRPALEALGLILRAREPDHRFFRPPADQPRTVHVHVCQRGSTWERDHLLFRDYLRAHPDKAHDYAALKRQLAEAVGYDRSAYTAGKTTFIEQTLRDADAWARHTTKPPRAPHPPTNHDDMSPTTSRPPQPGPRRRRPEITTQ